MKKLNYRILSSLYILAMVINLLSCSTKDSNQNVVSGSSIHLTNDADSIGYYTGYFTVANLKRRGVEKLNTDAFYKGIEDAFSQKDQISKTELDYMIGLYFEKFLKKKYKKNLEDGNSFLEKNKSRQGVVTTTSGLQYEIIKEGTIKPGIDDEVYLHFTGKRIDGKTFLNTYQEETPQAFTLHQDTVKNSAYPIGWHEALALMKVGSKYKFYFSADLSFKDHPPVFVDVEPNMAMIFDIEMVGIVPDKK